MDITSEPKNTEKMITKCTETFPMEYHRNTIKYTKLPEYDFDAKATWNKNSYVLPARLRRIIAIDDELIEKSKSHSCKSEWPQHTERPVLKSSVMRHEQATRSVSSSRKVVTISEDHYTKNDNARNNNAKQSNEEGKRSTKRQFYPKHNRNLKLSNSKSNTESQNEKNTNDQDTLRKNQNLMTSQHSASKRSRDVNVKGTTLNTKPMKSSKTNLTKSNVNNEKEEVVGQIKNKLLSDIKSRPLHKNRFEKPLHLVNDVKPRSLSKNVVEKPLPKSRILSSERISQILKKTQPISTTIFVPIEEKINERFPKERKQQLSKLDENEVEREDSHSVEVIDLNISPYVRDVNYNTEVMGDDDSRIVDHSTYTSKLELKDSATEMDITSVEKNDKSTEVDKTNLGGFDKEQNVTGIDSADFENILHDINLDDPINNHDNLNVPNVSLLKDNFQKTSYSLPNIQKDMSDTDVEKIDKNSKIINNISINKSTSYLIGRATLTYTTKKKIDFHVIGQNNELVTTGIPLLYPLSVVSVLRNEMNKNEIRKLPSNFYKRNDSQGKKDSVIDLKVDGVNYLDSSTLVKPSEIIRAMKLNNHLIDSEFNCEQFQRELNFIDTFFESLQFLENSSLSKKSLTENKYESLLCDPTYNLKDPEYQMLLSKLETEDGNEEAATMASRSLCLLNLLIRDEQRRAKNLLLVLKMREDALKDFTKSHIIWLENKKKQDNTDLTVSTLKKKQRGALLKLQHECGEMQRMRKALLALSEKRKLALMKTKKIIELKLKNNINTDQIAIGKKKIKRNTVMDRNIAPLKCFDLSSSGCDEGNSSQPKSKSAIFEQETSTLVAEKCIQTSDSITYETKIPQATETSSREFVTVDGTYLNILFQSLSLPPIFGISKSYEVNEKALKNVINSTTVNSANIHNSDVVEKFMDEIKNHDLDKSSSPSTARSLIEEFDQYYKDVLQENGAQSPDRDKSPRSNNDDEEKCVPKATDFCLTQTSSSTVIESSSTSPMFEFETSESRVSSTSTSPSGPLPVPEGAPTIESSTTSHVASKLTTLPSRSDIGAGGAPVDMCVPALSMAAPGFYEAEELRRQQLAIEREIKALEQQQNQLLVLREIPDKPPPPYTPPADTRSLRPSNTLVVDDITEHQIYRIITQDAFNDVPSNDAFEIFVNDFCQESITKNKSLQSDMPWDSCNLLPQKSQLTGEQLAKKTSQELKEILSGTKPTSVSGVSARRSDHIDDILFTEWRRCEPEWTKLHVDETDVKNQLFERIFDKLLEETILEYKNIVPSRNYSSEENSDYYK